VSYHSQQDQIEFSTIVKILYNQKWLIILGTGILVVLAILLTFFLPHIFQSRGFYQLQDVSTPQYKTYSSLFSNAQHFNRFLDHYRKKNEIEANVELKVVSGTEELASYFTPVFAYTADDLRQLAQLGKDKDNFVVGVNVTGEGISPDSAHLFASILGEYIADCILYGIVSEFITTGYHNSEIRSKTVENTIIENEFKLQQLQDKLEDIKELSSKYPQSRSVSSKEFISIEPGGYRYLSPITQMVGIESELADIRQLLSENHRSNELLEIRLEFFRAARVILNEVEFGTSLLQQCQQVKTEMFDGKDINRDTVREVFNDLSIEFDKFVALRERMIFVSGPTKPERISYPKKIFIVVMSALFALCFFIVLAFILEWWRKNRQAILD